MSEAQTKEITVQGTQTFMSTIERLATNPDVDVNKIKQIVDMQEHILDREAQQAFNAAMVRAQRDMPIVPKDRKNEQTRSRYSSYEMILKYTKPIYTQAGFSISMYEGETVKENNIRVCADVMHENGHTKQYWTDVPIDDKGIKGSVNKTQTHAKGSSLSYGKSYLMKMIFNIPTGHDDDGNVAGGSETISIDQQTEITDLITEVYKGKGEKFLKWLGVESVETIPVSMYKKAINALKATKEKMQ